VFELILVDDFIVLPADQHIRLYNTEKSKFCCFKNIKAKEVGWTIVDVSYSPDQNYLIYSSWCDSSKLGSGC
jgi:hypothetical protein